MLKTDHTIPNLGASQARESAWHAVIFDYPIVEHFKAIWAGNSPQSPPRAAPLHRPGNAFESLVWNASFLMSETAQPQMPSATQILPSIQ